MLSHLIWFTVSLVLLFGPKDRHRYAYHKDNAAITIFTSFFMNENAVQYYYNMLAFILCGNLIEAIIDNHLILFVLTLLAHVGGTYLSFIYYQTAIWGASFVIYSWLGLIICSQYPNQISVVIFFFAISIDYACATYLKFPRQCAHIGHIFALCFGAIFWHLISNEDRQTKVNNIFASAMRNKMEMNFQWKLTDEFITVFTWMQLMINVFIFVLSKKKAWLLQ